MKKYYKTNYWKLLLIFYKNKYIGCILFFVFFTNNLYSYSFLLINELTFISNLKIDKSISVSQTKFLNYFGYNKFDYFIPAIIFGVSDCIIDDKNFAKLTYDYHLTYGLSISGKRILNFDNFNIVYNIKYLLTDFKNIPNLANTHLIQRTLSVDLISSYLFLDFIEPYISIGYLKDSFEGDFNLQNENKINIKLGSIFNLTDYIRFNFSALFLGQKGIYAGLEYNLDSGKTYQTTETKNVKQCPVCKSYYHLEDNYCGFDGTELKPRLVPLNKKIIFVDSK